MGKSFDFKGLLASVLTGSAVPYAAESHKFSSETCVSQSLRPLV